MTSILTKELIIQTLEENQKELEASGVEEIQLNRVKENFITYFAEEGTILKYISI